MEYWNNPLIETAWPSKLDPVADSLHNGTHCIFYNPAGAFDHISTNQRLGDLCNWANDHIKYNGTTGFLTDPKNFYDIANLVKLNMWVRDIKKQGIVKPWLVQDLGDGTYVAGTGDSRLRALERIPEITKVPMFISTHNSRKHLYKELESVTTFDRFAELCGATLEQVFLFRLTDPTAVYGLYWYEYNSPRTRAVTPGESDCVNMLSQYFVAHPNTTITPEWFDLEIAWDNYKV